jgi:outer membrane biosynthesis protein TonB
MEKPTEKNNDRTAWTVSILIHALLIIAFIFMVAWREPNPPHPEYGIQINFGTDDAGTGDIQPTQPANTAESEEEADPAPAEQEIVEEQPVEEAVAETESTEEVVDPVAEESTAQETPTETITQKAPSPDVIEEEPQPKEIVEPKVVEEEPKEQPKVEETKEEKDPVKTPVLYESKDNNTTDGTGESAAEATKANHGDDTDATGDKGQEDGSLNAQTLYGNQGGGGGAPALNMSGWMWDFKPSPKDDSDENGRIVFEVKIDEDGEIISVRTLERSVNTTVENVYRREIEKLTFTKTSDNHSTAAISTGTITFVIKSK